MKISKKQFNVFKKEVLRLIKLYGLSGWEVAFHQENLTDAYGEIATDARTRCVCFFFPTIIDDKLMNRFNPLQTAQHEVFHLLLAPLSDLAEQRYIVYEQIYTVEEDIVNKLIAII